jgi:hypothetical protein
MTDKTCKAKIRRPRPLPSSPGDKTSWYAADKYGWYSDWDRMEEEGTDMCEPPEVDFSGERELDRLRHEDPRVCNDCGCTAWYQAHQCESCRLEAAQRG